MNKDEFVKDLYNHVSLFGSTSKEIVANYLSIKKQYPQKTIVISKNDFMNAKKFKFMCSVIQDKKIYIRTNANEVFSEEELKKEEKTPKKSHGEGQKNEASP